MEIWIDKSTVINVDSTLTISYQEPTTSKLVIA